MRGKEAKAKRERCSDRITPAHAGKSNTFQVEETGKEDHPRTCGEKVRYFQRVQRFAGSPPHMRGKD